MNAHDLTLLQRLLEWAQEREMGALSVLSMAPPAGEGDRRFSVAVDRRGADDRTETTWGGWQPTLGETLRSAAQKADLPTGVEAPADNAERLAVEMNQVRSALGRVGVYQGLSGPSPIPLMVDELVRDHEVIETRMDAILHLLVSTRESPGVSQEVQDLIFEIGEIAAGRRDFVDARELTGEQ